MTQYRKKPVVIEAQQWDGSWSSALAIFAWSGTGYHVPEGAEHPLRRESERDPGDGHFHEDRARAFLVIPTLEGDMRADRGDWIIRGVQGEFYPCKPDIFAATYGPAAPSEDTRMSKLLASIPEVADMLGVGRTTVYGLIEAGELETVHVGARHLAVVESAEAYVARKRAKSGAA